MNGFPEWKIPCSCPKGGMYEEGSICSKCGGSEWIVNPELVALFEKELDKAREEGCADGLELEQLLNAEFFEEDYQNPKRLKELMKRYKLKTKE